MAPRCEARPLGDMWRYIQEGGAVRIEDFNLDSGLIAVQQAEGLHDYEQAVERVSGAEHTSVPVQPAEPLTEAARKRIEIVGISQAVTNVQDAAAVIDTAKDSLKRMHGALAGMKSAAGSAVSASAEQRAELDEQYHRLAEELAAAAEDASFNGEPLFDGGYSRDNGGLIMQAGAGTGQVIAMYYERVDTGGLAAHSLSSGEDAKAAQAAVAEAMKALSKEQAKAGEYHAQLKDDMSGLVEVVNSLAEDESRLADHQEAMETTQAVCEDMASAPNKAMGAQVPGINRQSVEVLLS